MNGLLGAQNRDMEGERVVRLSVCITVSTLVWGCCPEGRTFSAQYLSVSSLHYIRDL